MGCRAVPTNFAIPIIAVISCLVPILSATEGQCTHYSRTVLQHAKIMHFCLFSADRFLSPIIPLSERWRLSNAKHKLNNAILSLSSISESGAPLNIGRSTRPVELAEKHPPIRIARQSSENNYSYSPVPRSQSIGTLGPYLLLPLHDLYQLVHRCPPPPSLSTRLCHSLRSRPEPL